MKRICAWCQKNLGNPTLDDDKREIITHGICPECADALFAEDAGTTLLQFLKTFHVPIIVADDEAIRAANPVALQLLRKELPDIIGGKEGNVFECAYASLPEGCGNTVHCSGCVIRNTVMDTYYTGNSHLKLPAALKRGGLDASEDIDLLISTEKLKDIVLLRIDRVERVNKE
jgi:hypothetical protein